MAHTHTCTHMCSQLNATGLWCTLPFFSYYDPLCLFVSCGFLLLYANLCSAPDNKLLLFLHSGWAALREPGECQSTDLGSAHRRIGTSNYAKFWINTPKISWRFLELIKHKAAIPAKFSRSVHCGEKKKKSLWGKTMMQDFPPYLLQCMCVSLPGLNPDKISLSRLPLSLICAALTNLFF